MDDFIIYESIFLKIGTDDVLISSGIDDMYPVTFTCELLDWYGFLKLLGCCWFFSANGEDTDSSPISIWECMVQWAIIF